MLWGHCSIDLLTIWNDCCETLALCQTKKMKILKNREWPVLKKGSHSGCFSQPGEVLQQCAPAYCFFAHLGETGLFGRKWFQTSPEKKVDQICWAKKILQQTMLAFGKESRVLPCQQELWQEVLWIPHLFLSRPRARAGRICMIRWELPDLSQLKPLIVFHWKPGRKQWEGVNMSVYSCKLHCSWGSFRMPLRFQSVEVTSKKPYSHLSLLTTQQQEWHLKLKD